VLKVRVRIGKIFVLIKVISEDVRLVSRVVDKCLVLWSKFCTMR